MKRNFENSQWKGYWNQALNSLHDHYQQGRDILVKGTLELHHKKLGDSRQVSRGTLLHLGHKPNEDYLSWAVRWAEFWVKGT